MRLSISVEARLFMRTPNGEVWSSGAFPYSFWTRYLDVFEQVQVIARVADVSTGPEGDWKRADGEAVSFHAVPYYVGAVQYARRFFSISASMRNSLNPGDAVLMRLPSAVASHLQRRLARSQPFAVELLGDVNAVFAPGAIKHPLRPIFRKRFTTQLKRQCRKACAIAYVTSVLERDYPPGPYAFATVYSMVDLEDNAFAPSSRTFALDSRPKRVISVGTLDVLYKGFDVLMQAVSECVQAGLDLELVIVGDGRRRAELERFAQEFGIGQRVKFAGRLPPGAAVREALDGADLFVLASKTEGLPSAMIEAMARALPCIGSAVGGIPELLPTEDLVPRGDAAALAHKIREVLSDPQRMARMSSSNLARARDYHASVLTGRRRQFYGCLREATRLWNQRNVAPHPEGMSTYEGRAS